MHTQVATSPLLVHMLQMCVPTHMNTHDTFPLISTTHMHEQFSRLLHTPMNHSNPFGGSCQMYHTTVHQYVWFMVCFLQLEVQTTRMDQARPLPYMASIMMIRSGSMWVTCRLLVPWRTHCCCQEAGCWWLMAKLNRSLRLLCKVHIAVLGIELIKLLLGLAKLFPITPTPMEADKRQKDADERYKEYVIGGRYSE